MLEKFGPNPKEGIRDSLSENDPTYYRLVKSGRKKDQKPGPVPTGINYERQYIQKLTTNYGPLCEPVVRHQLRRRSTFSGRQAHELVQL